MVNFYESKTGLENPTKPPFEIAWSVVLVAGLLVVLVSHLGYMPLDTRSDEPRRALVALEMIISGDYITPTLNGERYFNKPPLYNWLIAASYRAFGNYSSFALRFPMLVSLLLFGITIYVFVRRYANSVVAFAAAMMTLTNGRVLLYDSMLGLIEITFGWVTYTSMLCVFHFSGKRQYWLLYLTTYMLTAVGFMLKGLPSLAFQALTVGGWLLYTKQHKRLFHPAHFVGICLFLGLAGAYYWMYFEKNSIPVSNVANVLFTESAKRTGLHYGLGKTLLHLATFPFEAFYHFVPYLFLLILLTRRAVWGAMRSKPFIVFNALAFGVNVLVYWTSPNVYGRYLIGLMPLLLTVLAWTYYEQAPPDDRFRWWTERIWLVLVSILAIGVWVSVFLPATESIPGVLWKTAIVSSLLAGLAWWMYRPSANRLGLMIGVMIVTRLGINWLVLPGRVVTRQFYKDSAEQAARLAIGHPLYGYKKTVGNGQATDVSSFHIEAIRDKILPKTYKKIPGAYYIADSISLVGERYQTLGKCTLFDKHPAYVVRFDP